MTEKEAIEQLKFEREMILFDPSTGESYEPVELKIINKDNYKTYIADGIAIKALEEVQQYREIGTVDDFQRLDYLKSRYEDETYDYCGEYGTSECGLKDRVKKLEEYEAIGTVDEVKEAMAFYRNVKESSMRAIMEKCVEYEKIGTVEECRAAVEKEKPKKPDYEGDGYADGHMVYDTWVCPCCETRYEVDYDDYKYCPNCGQAIDWSEEE